ncbi:MAG: ribosome maturation factor RimP [Gammaproteobacteria bacterium]
MKLDSDGLEALFAPIVQGLGFDLWGVQLRSSENHAHLKIFIDHDDGITVDNCSEVSHQISGILDVEDPISVAYTLEVSSPGLDRPLMKHEHFAKYLGKEIKVRLGWPVNERRNFLGTLTKLDEEDIMMMVDGELVEFPFNAVKRANLIYSD